MRNRGLITTVIFMAGIFVMLVVMILLMQTPSILDMNETANRETFPTREYIQETEPQIILTTNRKKYTAYDGKANIYYPEINGLNNSMEKYINEKIYINATSLMALYPIYPSIDSLNIDFEIKYLDVDKVVIVYKGSYYGVNSKTVSKPKTSQGTRKSVPRSNNDDLYMNDVIAPQSYNYVPPTTEAQYQAPTYETVAPPSVQVIDDSLKIITAPNTVVTENSYQNGIPSFTTNSRDTANADTSSLAPGQVRGYTSVDSSKQTNIYYTNVIDLNTAKDIYLNYYDNEFLNDLVKTTIEGDNAICDSGIFEKVKAYIKKNYTKDKLMKLFKASDFRNTDLKSWPEIFTYELDGSIYYSLKVSNALGDYVIFKY